jgi:hypothetical protein
MLVDLANKLGTPLAKDVDSLRRNLTSAVGKGGYSPAASSGSSSAGWRSAPAAPAASNGSSDRWSSYSRSSPASSGGYGSAAAGGDLSARELGVFKVGVCVRVHGARSSVSCVPQPAHVDAANRKLFVLATASLCFTL